MLVFVTIEIVGSLDFGVIDMDQFLLEKVRMVLNFLSLFKMCLALEC